VARNLLQAKFKPAQPEVIIENLGFVAGGCAAPLIWIGAQN
jgi:hypothetical protein